MGKHLLVVKREAFVLEIWRWRSLPPRQYRLIQSIPISIGQLGFDTPAGVYRVTAKARHPEWRMPDSSWVLPENRGKVVPGDDPANPIKAAFLRLTDDGVGIHGTADLASLGTAASHGCIRVTPAVAIDLHKRIKKGTPVVII